LERLELAQKAAQKEKQIKSNERKYVRNGEAKIMMEDSHNLIRNAVERRKWKWSSLAVPMQYSNEGWLVAASLLFRSECTIYLRGRKLVSARFSSAGRRKSFVFLRNLAAAMRPRSTRVMRLGTSVSSGSLHCGNGKC